MVKSLISSSGGSGMIGRLYLGRLVAATGVQMAGRDMPGCQLAHRRDLDRAALERVRAAQPEDAARRAMMHFSDSDVGLPAAALGDRRDRRDQELGVGMTRMAEDRLDAADLADGAGVP